MKDPVRTLKTRIHTLIREHADASARVDDYAKRRFLSAGEQAEMRGLQRLKLLKKDTLTTLQRDLLQLEQPASRVG